MVNPSIYDQLAKEPLSDLTVTQLNSGSSVTAIDQATIEYWRGPITLARIAQSSRTYAHGLPIPEASVIEVIPILAGESAVIQPSGSEVWTIQGIEGTGVGGAATCSLSWYDGSSEVVIDAGQSFSSGGNDFEYSTTPPITAAQPLTLTNSLYLKIAETGTSVAVIFNVAIHKVSL